MEKRYLLPPKMHLCLLRDYVCRECHSKLEEVPIDGLYELKCSRDHSHRGVVTQWWASRAVARAHEEYRLVLRNYPHLNPLTAEQRRERARKAAHDIFA